MKEHDVVVAVFDRREAADRALNDLSSSGFDLKNLSVVGKGSDGTDERFSFHKLGDRMVFWGSRGAFWGALWGLFSVASSSRSPKPAS